MYGLPRVTTTDDYYPLDEPPYDDFRFEVSPENSAFIQASIKTARELYAPFDLFIQASQEIEPGNININFARRNHYPSYLRNSTAFEIFTIYNSEREYIRHAKTLINDIQVEPEKYENYMRQRGYIRLYMGFISYFAIDNHPAINATKLGIEDEDLGTTFPLTPLTPNNFRGAITQDQLILMEYWRRKILEEKNISLMSYWNLIGSSFKIQSRYETYTPLITNIGFSHNVLRNKILEVNEALGTITREFIMYEGETARSPDNEDISQRKLPLNIGMRKSYFMMIYNELIKRNVIDENGNVIIH